MPDNASRHNEPFMPSVISVTNLSKTYASGFQALRAINLDIRRGEIFALLGPNGAGKTTLINIICGIVNPTEGRVLANGHDIVADYRAARSKIGLVPQELTTDAFETVWATVSFSRGLFGKPRNPALVEKLLGFDAVVIAGQAKSHCVAWTIDDLLLRDDARASGLTRRTYLLEDCTSPVVVTFAVTVRSMTRESVSTGRSARTSHTPTTLPSADRLPQLDT